MNLRSKFIAIAGSALLLASSLTMGSAADPTDTGNATVKIKEGTISVEIGDANFGEYSYSLTNETYTGVEKLTVKVDDLRGTAKGWNVNLKATDFTPTVADTNAESFLIGNLTLTPDDAAKRANVEQKEATLEGQTTRVMNPVKTTDQSVWTAPNKVGDGRFDLPLKATLVIPAGTLVNTYSSTVTVTLAAAPVAP